MGVRQRLAVLALDASHVLVVEAPGGWLARVTVEREVARRGWRLATSAADADALVLVGAAGPELRERVDAVWEQLPGPRSRVALPSGPDVGHVAAALDAVAAELLDGGRQAQDARERGGPEIAVMGGGDMGDADTGDADTDDGDMGDGDMGDGDMQMAPSGIPLAEGGADRDGLEMDALHVPLGPVLPHWPAGLVLRCVLQGDVVVEAGASVLDKPDIGFQRPTRAERAARRCDEVAGLLALAGWAGGHSAAVDARDLLLDHPDAVDASALLAGLERRLRRARLLRWSLRGIGELRSGEDGLDVPAHLDGDVAARLLHLAGRIRAELAGDALPEVSLPDLLATAERLVVGLDLAAARLVIASLAIDTAPPRIPVSRIPEEVRDA